MSTEKKYRVGTLGSAATFAGEATRNMRRLYPEFGEAVYFPSMDACWDELKKGTVDVVVLGSERTGQPHHGDPVIKHGFFVLGEFSQPLNCNLYVKPGAQKSSIRRITGHGSIFQCTAYLDREFPGIPREAHGLNSVEAAKAVMSGDGSLAVVGSPSLPEMVEGLEVVAAGIDDGAVSSWWAVSSRPAFSNTPDSMVIASRCGRDGQLGRIVSAVVAQSGSTLQTIAAFPVNAGVSVYDYLLMFTGKCSLEPVRQGLAQFPDTRLVGAFEGRRGV